MPSIIGSVSCSTGSHQPVLVCFASALFALFLIGGSFPPRGRCSLARPILRPAWSRRYLFKFQHALGHRPGPIPELPSLSMSRFDFRCEAYNNCRVGTLDWKGFGSITSNGRESAFTKF